MTPRASTSMPRRRLGRTSVEVGILGFGGATIGGIGAQVTEAHAQATLDAWDAGLRYFDTAPWYGRGVSELRVGRLLREKPPDQFVISTKVGRILRSPASLPPDGSPWHGGGPFEVQFDYSH